MDPEQINLKKCDPEPEFEERKYVFGQTTRKVKNPKKTEEEKKEAEKTAENVAYVVEKAPVPASSLWTEVTRFIGFQSTPHSEENAESSNTELRQYVFGQTKRPVKVTNVQPVGATTEESASYWSQMRRIIGVETKPASNTSEIPSNVGKEMKSQTKSINEPSKNKKSRKPPPPIPPPFATSSDSHSELDEFKPPRRPPYQTGENETKSSPNDNADSSPGYWNRSLTSIKGFFVRKNDD